MGAREIVSAGGVVYKVVQGRVFFALVGRRRRNYWCLPKGRTEKGETEIQAAKREVFEEAGLTDVEVGEKIGTISYEFRTKDSEDVHRKYVHFYLMKAKNDSLNVGTEFDRAMWFTPADALNMVTHSKEKEIVIKAAKMLNVSL